MEDGGGSGLAKRDSGRRENQKQWSIADSKRADGAATVTGESRL